jgi:hypothetical protein
LDALKLFSICLNLSPSARDSFSGLFALRN